MFIPTRMYILKMVRLVVGKTDVKPEKSKNFSLPEYCNKSFGIYQETPIDITLEFDKSVKDDVLNYHFHPTQKIKELDNGNIQVKFTSGGTYAICQELFK